MNKTRLIVVDGHTLGIFRPEQPSLFGIPAYTILHASILRGAVPTYPHPRTWDHLPMKIDDTGNYVIDESRIRNATREDFEDFRVFLGSYEKHLAA
jgi:hypothetical protein